MTPMLVPSLIALREHLHLRLRPAVRPEDEPLIDDGILLCEAAIAAALGSEPPLEELRQRGLLSTDDKLPTEFYHGTKAVLSPGDLIEPGRPSNYGERNAASFVYLTGSLDAAAWGAELAVGDTPGRIYVVEPTGPIMPDPDLTKGGGNPTRSYRSEQPLRVTGEYTGAWGHAPITIKRMKDRIARMAQKAAEG